jgi:hypothetical protein
MNSKYTANDNLGFAANQYLLKLPRLPLTKLLGIVGTKKNPLPRQQIGGSLI